MTTEQKSEQVRAKLWATIKSQFSDEYIAWYLHTWPELVISGSFGSHSRFQKMAGSTERKLAASAKVSTNLMQTALIQVRATIHQGAGLTMTFPDTPERQRIGKELDEIAKIEVPYCPPVGFDRLLANNARRKLLEKLQAIGLENCELIKAAHQLHENDNLDADPATWFKLGSFSRNYTDLIAMLKDQTQTENEPIRMLFSCGQVLHPDDLKTGAGKDFLAFFRALLLEEKCAEGQGIEFQMFMLDDVAGVYSRRRKFVTVTTGNTEPEIVYQGWCSSVSGDCDVSEMPFLEGDYWVYGEPQGTGENDDREKFHMRPASGFTTETIEVRPLANAQNYTQQVNTFFFPEGKRVVNG